jgi:hypothetical protein
MKKNKILFAAAVCICLAVLAVRCDKVTDNAKIPVYSMVLYAEMGHGSTDLDSAHSYCIGTGICGSSNVYSPGSTMIPVQFTYDGQNSPDKLTMNFSFSALSASQFDQSTAFTSTAGPYQFVIACAINTPEFAPLNIPASYKWIPLNPVGSYTINGDDVTIVVPISATP